MWNHFPPGCWGFCDNQTIYVETRREIHVPLNCFFYIKGCVWKTLEAEWHPHVHTMSVKVVRVHKSES
jgi:hypothetical protein